MKGRLLAAEPGQFRLFNDVEWVDSATHVRLVDRSSETTVGLVYEDRAVAARIASLREERREADPAD